MISVASTLLLASLVFGVVPSVSAAPVGTRSMNVKEMRRMESQGSQPVRSRAHHSSVAPVVREPAPAPVAASVIPRTEDSVAPVVREPAPAPVAASVIPRTEDSVAAAVVARAGAPPSNPNSSNTTTTTVQKMRRHHTSPDADTTPRAVPRFKRDETAKRSATPDAASAVQARKEDATESNIARARDADAIVTRAEDNSSSNIESRDKLTTSTTTIGKRRLNLSDTPASSGTPASHAPRDEDGSIPPTKREEAKVADMPVKRDGPIKPIAMFRRALAWEDLD